jgi:hypothetical protein
MTSSQTRMVKSLAQYQRIREILSDERHCITKESVAAISPMHIMSICQFCYMGSSTFLLQRSFRKIRLQLPSAWERCHSRKHRSRTVRSFGDCVWKIHLKQTYYSHCLHDLGCHLKERGQEQIFDHNEKMTNDLE